jgi:hypothetical protein
MRGAPKTLGMKANAASAATMTRIPTNRTPLRAPMLDLALAPKDVASAACTIMVVDASPGSCDLAITCGEDGGKARVHPVG